MIQEILVIVLHELRLGLTSKRVLFSIGIMVLSAILITTTAVNISRSKGATMITAFGQMGVSGKEKKQMRKLLKGFMGRRGAIVEYRMQTPLLLTFVFLATLICFLIAMLAYDAVAGEVQGGAIRFLLSRARRSSILLGKFFAQAFWMALLLFLGNLVVVFSGLYALEGPLVAWLREAASLSFLAWIMSVGYLGWVILASSLVRRPFLGLMLSIAGLLVMGIVGLTRIQSFSPNFYKLELLGPPAMAMQASGVFLGFAVVMLGIAMIILQARDL